LIRQVGIYEGPAVVLLEGSSVEEEVTAWLLAAVEPGSPIPRWRGRLLPRNGGALWSAHLAGWASLVIGGTYGDFRITAYSDSGPSSIEGIGPAPFT